MPSVAVSVFTRDRIVFEGVQRAGRDDWWDLASLTKVLVTQPEALARFDIDATIESLWPRAQGAPVASATIGDLLSHTAGLPDTVQFFRRISGRDAIVDACLDLPVKTDSAAVYSDIGFILLGALIEDVTGRSLASLALERTGLRYAPLPGPAVPTEQCAWRGRLAQGEVHDENAYAMGGISGHAGAFGTLDLVTAAARSRLDEPQTCRSVGVQGERFGLGWWLTNSRGIGGNNPGPNGFGHSGFVGNRVWLEPDHGYGVVILSNRVHPTRDADRAPFISWCYEVLDAAATHLRPR